MRSTTPWQSVYVLLIFGVVGYVLVKAGFPLAPLILGLILGDQIEINLIRAIMTDDNPWLFLTRPISGGLLAAAALSVALAVWQHLRHQKRTAGGRHGFLGGVGGAGGSAGPRPDELGRARPPKVRVTRPDPRGASRAAHGRHFSRSRF